MIQCDGMTIAYASYLRDSDSLVYYKSGMKAQIEGLYVNGDPNRPAMAIGDQACKWGDHMAPTMNEAASMAVAPHMRHVARENNVKNRRFRLESDESFNKIVVLFPYVDCFMLTRFQ